MLPAWIIDKLERERKERERRERERELQIPIGEPDARNRPAALPVSPACATAENTRVPIACRMVDNCRRTGLRFPRYAHPDWVI
jgi:hypothetical protein